MTPRISPNEHTHQELKVPDEKREEREKRKEKTEERLEKELYQKLTPQKKNENLSTLDEKKKPKFRTLDENLPPKITRQLKIQETLQSQEIPIPTPEMLDTTITPLKNMPKIRTLGELVTPQDPPRCQNLIEATPVDKSRWGGFPGPKAGNLPTKKDRNLQEDVRGRGGVPQECT